MVLNMMETRIFPHKETLGYYIVHVELFGVTGKSVIIQLVIKMEHHK